LSLFGKAISSSLSGIESRVDGVDIPSLVVKVRSESLMVISEGEVLHTAEIEHCVAIDITDEVTFSVSRVVESQNVGRVGICTNVLNQKIVGGS
jgi:hypothetical protein